MRTGADFARSQEVTFPSDLKWIGAGRARMESALGEYHSLPGEFFADPAAHFDRMQDSLLAVQ